MLSPERIKHFVQNTIGHRLLTSIAEAGTAGCIEEHLPVLVKSGRTEREEKGLNRFKLVLVTDEPNEVRQSAERLFEELRGTDEKVHLHVIGRNDFPLNTAIKSKG